VRHDQYGKIHKLAERRRDAPLQRMEANAQLCERLLSTEGTGQGPYELVVLEPELLQLGQSADGARDGALQRVAVKKQVRQRC